MLHADGRGSVALGALDLEDGLVHSEVLQVIQQFLRIHRRFLRP